MENTEKLTSIHEKMVRIKNLPTPTVKAIKFEKYFFPFFPVGGTSVYPVDKQQPRTGRTKLILAVSALSIFSFRSWCPSFRFNLMCPFRSLPSSVRFASSFPCVTSVLSFHVLYSVRYCFPFVSTLRVVSTLRFRSLRLSFRSTVSLLCVTSVRSFQA